MTDPLPLLVFPEKRVVPPEPRRGFPIGGPHLPGRQRQVARVNVQLDELQASFARYQASVAGAMAGMEPETVLVMEIAGSVDDFKQAVDAAGLEWLGEWDLDGVQPDDDFYEVDSRGQRTDKLLKGRLFLSMSNEAGLRELLSLWAQWTQGRALPRGKGKWADVFSQLLVIRRWGIEETLRETGMIHRWHEMVDPLDAQQPITFQIELFYRHTEIRRRQNEQAVRELLAALDGRTLGPFIDMNEIAFHAVKAELPAERIRQLLAEVGDPAAEVDIQLFKFPGIMYFRPTGQSLAVADENEGDPAEFKETAAELPPVAALLDGAPLLLHKALEGKLLFDDPFDIERLYQPGERRHGTSMASLIVNGDLSSGQSEPLRRKVYCTPIMQPDPNHADRGEHMPDDVFFEDRIHLAVRRMFEGAGDVPAQAPLVKVVNLSIGDSERPFIHTPSPWARLLDWLSWKYRVLFCVSAGNFPDDFDIGVSYGEFSELSDEDKVCTTIRAVSQNLSSRRLLSPAESLNAITVGALHTDESGEYPEMRRIDVMPNESVFSPAMRLGHGFRRAIKPEVLFPGGRQLYQTPNLNGSSVFRIDRSKVRPGQTVAWDSSKPGELANVIVTRGTSNATALATRSAARIYEMLEHLREQEGEALPEPLIAVLIKALLIHGAKQPESAKDLLTSALKNDRNSRQFREIIARYIGYGAADIERVLTCTAQRATVLGCGEIRENEVHEYAFPLPIGLSAQKLWRRLVVTLAWFTPINSDHRNLREAKLELAPGGSTWDETSLRLSRQDGDRNQVLRGTVQHEVLEGERIISAYQDGEMIRIRVTCKKDATVRLDDVIPYGLAVTLEVKEDIDIPIYQQIRDRLKPQVVVGAGRR
ncbi:MULTISPECIES: S8 family peptidase [unclassified Burkholderia]|uniref:S8 family peptidase n=1 Tax=unclassified Burkholderia TaxID=2613784 RepID=UPI00141F5AAA|nr:MULTISPECIES: S8 family peptidase [unclassified Burkholderia]NIE83026.1 S8 family peptidase [Burkholderia sp. Tr-860]NIF62117.1 S8 family peptidase [Burkholderia sp. Cy-647]NIF96257.1 S8 family peptidase [Burkholderia sp. Ax-1720]